MKQKKDQQDIMQDFKLRQSRQFLAIALTLLLLILLTLLYKRPDVFGEFPKDTIFGAQIILIAAFAVYSALNWRCPSCNKYLGNNINRRICKKCGTRLW
ncbi:MAG: hypothetical protein WA126_06600 [Thermodesulfovibrionales bacterium]